MYWDLDIVNKSMEQSPPKKLTGLQLVTKFPAFYGTRSFFTIFKRNGHLFPF
jgi:hypothetical protein